MTADPGRISPADLVDSLLPTYTAHLVIRPTGVGPVNETCCEAIITGTAATVAQVIAAVADAFKEDAER